MFDSIKTQVLVIGAGPVGMMSALVLNRKGLDVILIDVATGVGTRSNSTLLHPSSLKLLQEWGVLNHILDAAYKIHSVKFYDGENRRATLDLENLETPFPYCVSLPQTTLEAILERQLEREGITILWNHKATGINETKYGIKAEVQRLSDQNIGYAVPHMERMVDKTKTIRANLAIAADGCNSLMRQNLQIEEFEGHKAEHFIMFDIKTKNDCKHDLRINLNDDLAVAQFPISNRISRMMFQFKGIDLPDDYRRKSRAPMQDMFEPKELLEDIHLQELLKNNVPWDPGYIERILWRVAVPFQQTFSKQIMAHNTVMLGDSCRTFEPISAASLNLGLIEAEKTCTTIAENFDNGQLMTELATLGNSFNINWQIRYNAQPYTTTTANTDKWIGLNRGRIMPCIPASEGDLERIATLLSMKLEMPHPAQVENIGLFQ